MLSVPATMPARARAALAAAEEREDIAQLPAEAAAAATERIVGAGAFRFDGSLFGVFDQASWGSLSLVVGRALAVLGS